MPSDRKARPVKLCANDDGGKHYAKGLCQACYMAEYRSGPQTPEEENRADAIPEPVAPDKLDYLLNQTSATDPSIRLAIKPLETDTEGVKLMRSKLANMIYLARREVVLGMLSKGYEDWQIKNEFLNRRDLFEQFILPLKDPDRTLDTDIALIQASGNLQPLERYIDGLRRSLRRANAFADDPDLSAKERSSWAKSADDIQRNLAIQERAIHVVPGKGDMPLGDFDDDEFDDDEDEGKGYQLPNVGREVRTEEGGFKPADDPNT